MYDVPQISDFERNLDTIAERDVDKARDELLRIRSDAAKHGRGQSNTVIHDAVAEFKKIHRGIIEAAMHLIHDYVSRSEISQSRFIEAARPKLIRAAETLLALVPEAGFVREANEIRGRYREEFRREREGALRDIETGFIGVRDAATPSGSTFNITHSSVGAINTGHVKQIEVSLNHLHKAGKDDGRDAIKTLTDAILNAPMVNEDKGQLIERVAFLGEQAAIDDPTQRKSTMIRQTLDTVTKVAGAVPALASAWQAAEPIVKQLFGY
jgi:alpha-D-ribose 1-methylphosphonate 5-triphosphate synthase subunit PhnG